MRRQRTGPEASRRLLALDAARGFAVWAMIVAHTAPFLRPSPRAVEFADGVLNDVAAPLFALIIGVTVAVAGPPVTAPADRRQRYRRRTAAKAVVLIVLGLLLDLRFSGVAIVLAYLGVTILAAIPLLFVRVRTLVLSALLLLVVGPGIITGLRATLANGLVLTDTPIRDAAFHWPVTSTLLDWIVLGRSYQLLTLLPLVLLGVAIGRTILSQRHPMLALLGVSFVAFVVMQLWKSMDQPGTGIRGGYVEVWRETPLALGALAGVVLLTGLASPRILGATRPLAEPFAVQGRLALSVYVLHVLILMGVYSMRGEATGDLATWFVPPRGWAIHVGLVLACWAFAAAWWHRNGTGPVERLLRWVNGGRPTATLLSRKGTA